MTDAVASRGQRDGRKKGAGRKARGGMNAVGGAICLVALSLVAVRGAFASSPGGGEILRKVGAFYSHLQDYHMVALLDNDVRRPGRFYPHHSLITLDAAGQGRVRMALKGDGLDVLIVSNGKATWYYAANKNEYTKREASAVLGTPGRQGQSAGRNPDDLLGQVQNLLVGRLVNLWQLRKAATFLGGDTIEFRGKATPCYRIEFHLKSLTDQLWIGRKSFLVLQEVLIHPVGTAAPQSYVIETVRMKEIDTHAGHAAGFFQFTPPAGAQRVAALHLPGVQEGLVGSQAGNFTLPGVKGKQVSLSDFRGKTVLLSFWATWCPPCKAELPTLEKIYEQHKDNVAVLAVDDESKAAIAKFMNEHHYGFAALMDHKRTLFQKFAVHFIPTVLVINTRGVIVREIVGWRGPQELFSAVKAGEQ